ncbi:MAG: hypothetical protein GXP29_02255 [Planctomycetes bacterium]|nr:hypothetical protein [Planctomycetota bacterium]
MIRRVAIWMALVFVQSVSAGAAITLEAPNYIATLGPDRAYTIETLTYNGVRIVDNIGSCQGTVLRESTLGWFGSCHGGETVIAVTLFVDGEVEEIVDGTVYQGMRFRLVKDSLLGDFANIHNEMALNENAIHETTSVTFLQNTSISVFYPFLSSHSNVFTEEVGINSPREFLHKGQTDLDDSSSLYLPGSNVIGQYDPSGGTGIATHFQITDSFDASNPFIWDRSADNKLYLRFLGFGNLIEAGEEFVSVTTRYPFSVDAADWQERVIRPLYGDSTRDGLVDLADFADFAACWQSPDFQGSEACVVWFDADGDQDVDLQDFAELQRNLKVE